MLLPIDVRAVLGAAAAIAGLLVVHVLRAPSAGGVGASAPASVPPPR